MKPTISVIIPVYKVEDYLEKCVLSVVAQTYKNIEIILVDDGSPDSCPEICDNLAKSDKRIHVIHKQNGGLSSARNAGLDISTGKYIYFLDSDDYIEPETLETMLNVMQSNDVDIVIAGVRPFYIGNEKHRAFDGMTRYFGKYNKPHKLFAPQMLDMPVIACGKLYKTDLIHKYNLRFDQGLINEDEAFNWYYNTMINRAMFIPDKFYNYLLRSDSIMGNKRKNGDKIGDILYIIDNVYDYLVKNKLLTMYKPIFCKWALSIIRSTKSVAQSFNNNTVIVECDKRIAKYDNCTLLNRIVARFLYNKLAYKKYTFIEHLCSFKLADDGLYWVLSVLWMKFKIKKSDI